MDFIVINNHGGDWSFSVGEVGVSNPGWLKEHWVEKDVVAVSSFGLDILLTGLSRAVGGICQ